MSAITLQGEIVHYEVLGRGRPLVFLHDWVGSWRYWIPAMQATSIAYRAYAIDLWGFGDTNKNAALYSLEDQVGLVEGFLESLGIAKIALVGHGLGAAVGLMFTERHPEMVDRTLLTGFPLDAQTINPRLRVASPAELAEWLLGRLPATEIAKVEAAKVDARAILASLEALAQKDLYDEVTRSPVPCLLVYGQNDVAVELPSVERLGALPERMHNIIFEQSGHYPMLDETTKYNRLLSDFLALNSGESPMQLQLKEEWKRRVR